MKHYHILDLSRTPTAEGHCVWWKPGALGRTTDLSQAGFWSERDVVEDQGYLNNGVTTKAVDHDTALAHSCAVVSWPIPE